MENITIEWFNDILFMHIRKYVHGLRTSRLAPAHSNEQCYIYTHTGMQITNLGSIC